MLDLRQLLALRAVDERGSVLAAAESLGWSQPTVAHHLAALSRLTSAPVVESSRSGTRLTPAGRLWLPHAIAMLDRGDQAQADVAAALARGRRRVRLGIFPTAAARLLPGLVATLTDAGYDPHVAEGELHDLAALLDRLAIDAAVVFDQPADESPSGPLRRTPLFSERFSLIVGSEHPLAHAGPQPLDAFRDTPWILGTSDADPGDAAFVAAARAAGFEPRLGPSSDDYRVVTAYVAAGLGVALVPELALPEGDERPSTLAIVELADLKLTREVSLLTAPTLEPSLVDVMATALTIDPRPIGSRLPIAR